MDKPSFEELFKSQNFGDLLYFFWRKKDRTELSYVTKLNYNENWYNSYINRFEDYHIETKYPVFVY